MIVLRRLLSECGVVLAFWLWSFSPVGCMESPILVVNCWRQQRCADIC